MPKNKGLRAWVILLLKHMLLSVSCPMAKSINLEISSKSSKIQFIIIDSGCPRSLMGIKKYERTRLSGGKTPLIPEYVR